MGMFRESQVYAVFALSGIILGAWYMLSLVRRTFFGRFHEPIIEGHHGDDAHPARDMNARELFALAPLLVLIVAIGLFPQFFIRRMEPSILQVSQTLAARQRLFHAPIAQQPQTHTGQQIAAKP
jgi:NADH-quinone oxidoreductase subunit M